jgi:hypothetical protein
MNFILKKTFCVTFFYFNSQKNFKGVGVRLKNILANHTVTTCLNNTLRLFCSMIWVQIQGYLRQHSQRLYRTLKNRRNKIAAI